MPVLLHFLVFIFLFITDAYAQEIPSEIQADKFVTELHQKGVDIICTYKYDCIGCIQIIDLKKDCTEKESCTFIFWKQNHKTYLTKKDNCHNYPIIEIKKDNFWDFYLTNRTAIASEKIKRPEFIVKEDDGEQRYYQSISHYGFDNITVYTSDIRQPLNNLPNYYFHKKVDNGGKNYKNINYEYNTNSFTNQLRLLLKLQIKKNNKKLEAVK